MRKFDIICIAMSMIVAIAIGELVRQAIHTEREALAPWENACVENAAGGIGVVTKAGTARMRVVFKSGLVEMYRKEELKRVECPHGMGADTPKQPASR